MMDLQQRNTLLQELFAHATECIIVINKTGEIRLINPATEKLFGYTQDELFGKKVEMLMPERVSKRHVDHRHKYNENPHSRSMGIGLDLFAKKKSGVEFPVEISLSPFRSNEEDFVIAFIIDITNRKIAEKQIIQHQQELEKMARELKVTNEELDTKVQDRTKVLQEALNEIEKSREEIREALERERELNELKSRFLSMASHEFRTPLTTILSSASLIPEYPAGDQQEKRLKHVDRIKSAVNNLNDILSDFLSLSKIEEGKVAADYKYFNLKNLITEVASELKGLCKNGQLIEVNYTGEEAIDLDPKVTRNIMINLISNAIKFSPEDSKIIINVNSSRINTIIEVCDQGIGISKEDQQHLFQRFFRGQNAINIQGTGLGLNIVSKYVELMDGFIQVESELEKGTKIRITFTNNTKK